MRMTKTLRSGLISIAILLTLPQPGLRAQTYVANQDSNNVSGFTINSATGALTPAAGSPFGAGVLPWNVTVDPTGRFAYVANQGSNNVSGYTINASTGALTPIAGSPWAAGAGAQSVAVDVTGRFAYVANVGANTLSGFTINPFTGALSPASGSPFSTGVGPRYVTLAPNGDFVYVVNGNDNTISAFVVNHNSGTLTQIAGSPFLTASFPVAIAIDPTGRFAYVVNNGVNGVSAYQINSSGALSSVAGSPFPTGNLPNSVAVDGTGRFVYVANYGDGTVSAYTISSPGGVLAPITGSPFAAAGVCAASVAIDPTSSFEYLADNCNGLGVLGYTINRTTGALSTIPGSPWPAGVGPFSIAVRQVIPDSSFSVPVFTDNRNGFVEVTSLTLGQNSPGINFAAQSMFLTYGSSSITIPPGSLRQLDSRDWIFLGAVNGVGVAVDVYEASATQYLVGVTAGLNLTSQPQPLNVGVQIGPNAGSANVRH